MIWEYYVLHVYHKCECLVINKNVCKIGSVLWAVVCRRTLCTSYQLEDQEDRLKISQTGLGWGLMRLYELLNTHTESVMCWSLPAFQEDGTRRQGVISKTRNWLQIEGLPKFGSRSKVVRSNRIWFIPNAINVNWTVIREVRICCVYGSGLRIHISG